MTGLGERRQVLAAELFGGWEVRIWARPGELYDAALTPPAAERPAWQVVLWPGEARTLESIAYSLGPKIRLAPAYVRSVLTALMDAETAP